MCEILTFYFGIKSGLSVACLAFGLDLWGYFSKLKYSYLICEALSKFY